jgi:hypothetical protein
MGAGVSLGLPWLECMADSESKKPSDQAKRFCAMYFGFGVSLPKEDSEHAKWRWFPNGEGKDFEWNESLKPLERHRNRLTVLGGLSHPHGRIMGAHDTGDTFLTGALLNAKSLNNTVSLDQVIAESNGDKTRFRSLVMSTDGGVGEPTRSSTLSYDLKGRPLPALHQPRRIFDRFFGAGDADLTAQRLQLMSQSAMLDRVLDDARSLRLRLGAQDRNKFDEYLSSIRQIEERVHNSQRWLEIPRPELRDEELKMLNLDSNENAPVAFIRTMYDLIYLAFCTDSTRVATYQITNMADASSKAGKFPQLEGFKTSLHTLAHDWDKPEGAENLGRWDRLMAEQFSHFLDRMAAAQEGNGSLLDNTLVLYGSSNSNTHNNNNYPLVLAGGNNLGMLHGRFLKFKDHVPLSNLFVTILDSLGSTVDKFADSKGELSELRT